MPELAALLEALYEGPLEEVPFRSFLALLRRALGAEASVLMLRPPTRNDTGLLLVEGGTRRWESAYQERFFAQDPFVNLPFDEVTALDDLISEEALLASDFYRDYMEPSGTFHVLGVNTREGDGLEARLRASRARGKPHFSKVERRVCQELVPHIRRAVRLHARITRVESERDLFAGAVDQLAMATILLDEAGRVLRTNRGAAELLRRGHGLRAAGGELRTEQLESTRELRSAIERALAHRSAGAPGVVEGLRLPVADGEALRVLVRPVALGRWSEGHAVAAVALFIGGSEEAAAPPLELFQQLFDFTRAEAALAVELAGGQSLDEAASALGVARNTARAHLRAIFSKTGVGRQSELVRLLLRSAPLA